MAVLDPQALDEALDIAQRSYELLRWLEEQRSREGLDWVALFRDGKMTARVRDASAVQTPAESTAWDAYVEALLRDFRVDGQAASRIERHGVRLVIHAVAPVEGSDLLAVARRLGAK